MPADTRREPGDDPGAMLAAVGARLLAEQGRVAHLRDAPAGEPPWPTPGHPLLAWQVAGAAVTARTEGVAAALPSLAVHAWREGGIAWERHAVTREAPPAPIVWPGSGIDEVEPHARAYLAGEPERSRALRAARPPASPWPRDGDVLLEHLVTTAAERARDGVGTDEVLLWLAMHAWREGAIARAAVHLGPPPPPSLSTVSARGR